MRVISAADIETALETPLLVERLRQAFRSGATVPVRHHHAIPASGRDGTLLLMPAWQEGQALGVKMITVFPDNAAQSLPSIMGVYLLLHARTGKPLALLDGPSLTLRRTAAASALAAGYLARNDARRLLMVGTGALAPHLIEAHAAVRPIREVLVWGRSPDKAEKLARLLHRRLPDVRATDNLEEAARSADVISCATLASEPLIEGRWLKPGTHLDLVGGFRPDMREADDDAVRRAGIFVDTRAGALAEAGDIVQPIESGALDPGDVAADLFELCRGLHDGRRCHEQITLFKSVGTALEDLAAARLAYRQT